MNDDDKRLLMERANDTKLRVNGVPVNVSGCANPFATVRIKPGHPLAGFSTQYSWETIQRAVESGGQLQ